MKEFKGQVNEGCAHLDLENYTCEYMGKRYMPLNPICNECLAGLYLLWKEAIWKRAKERSSEMFPGFGAHGKAPL